MFWVLFQVQSAISQIVGAKFDRIVVKSIGRLTQIEQSASGGGSGVKLLLTIILKSQPTDALITALQSGIASGLGDLNVLAQQVGGKTIAPFIRYSEENEGVSIIFNSLILHIHQHTKFRYNF